MKKLLTYSISIGWLFFVLSACHKVEVPVSTELTPDVFPQDSAQFVQAAGPAYVALRGNYGVEYFFQQSFSTDEGIMPARGGNWYDGGQNKEMHYHSWTRDNGYVNGNWTWLVTTIGATNQALSVLGKNMPAGSFKQTSLAELKMVRAFAYFMFMDNYGNVPIDTLYGDFSPKPNVPRAQVFDFIEGEIKSAIPFLSSATGITTYGRPNLYTAYALLAKMYLNAEIYTGTKRNDDCIAACDNIIQSGKYALASRDSYLKMFYPDNGPQTPEFIFAIPYDPSASNTLPFRSVNIHARYDVPRSETAKFGLPFTPGGPASTLPEYYAFFNDAEDVRNRQWLTGLQYMNDGVTPVTVATTNLGYNQFYSGSDPSAAYLYHVNLTPDIILRQDVSQFDAGNDEIGWNMGYRNIKFYPDASSPNRNQNNDIPVFRYADILLMKAEAILRGGAVTGGQTALSLVNEVRSQRTTAAAWTGITLETLFAERTREFAWEGWRRNDMIRFGKYEGKWGFKTNAESYRRIFPIPTAAFSLNHALTQNPGY